MNDKINDELRKSGSQIKFNYNQQVELKKYIESKVTINGNSMVSRTYGKS